MSETVRPGPSPLLLLPGFLPDAVSFAFRLALAVLLAYFVSFAMQLETASSAGICVAIVMQPSPGMAMSKAFYRVVGTVVGGVVGLAFLSVFPQDRTMLLAAFALWMGGCTYLASLLRDFRAYGATLAGYTVAIIAILEIDTPDGALLATLNRVAAILIGVVCVAFVNSVFVVRSAHEELYSELKRHIEALRRVALETLGGGRALDDEAYLRRLSDILGLRTQATYAAAELADGVRRDHAAESMIAGLLGMLAACRTIGRTLALAGPDGVAPATRSCLDAASEAIGQGRRLPAPEQLPAEPLDAVLMERAAALASEHRAAQAWFRAATTDDMRETPPPVRLRSDPDRVAAVLNAVRTIAAVGFGATFCVLSNDSTTGLTLVNLAALTALLGMQPNPSAAVAGFPPALPPAILVAGAITFLLLPQAFGFLPFALAVGAGAFILGLAFRHPRTAIYGPASLIFFSLLLSPSNTQSFDASSFLNTCLHLAVAVGLVVLTFRLILPVQPSRRLFRAVSKIALSLRHTVRHGCRPDRAAARQLLLFDRLSQAFAWASVGHPGRPALLSRICDLAELEAALCHAWSGLHDVEQAAPGLEDAGLAGAARAGRTKLGSAGFGNAEAEVLEQAARNLLAHPAAGDAPAAVLRAASGLHTARLLLQDQHRALRRYGVLGR